MKNLIILLLASTALISCQKETFEPNFANESNSANKTLNIKGTSKIECTYIFTENTNTSGHVDFYFGQNLSYVHNFTEANMRDTILGEDFPARYIKFTRYVSNNEISQNDGWFFVNIYLQDTVEFIYNKNRVNNKMALNGSEFLPEPSDKVENNTNVMTNFFKAEIPSLTIDAEVLVEDK